MILRLVLGVALMLLPLVWLGRQNPRAVPIGAFFLAFVVTGGIGALAVGGVGIDGGDARKWIATWLALLLLFGALFLVTEWQSGDSFAARTRWGVTSIGVWMLVGIIGKLVVQPVIGERTRREAIAADARDQARQRADADARERQRLARAAPPEGRAAQLDALLEGIRRERTANMYTLRRFVRFGDPAAHPESVTVWAVFAVAERDFHDLGTSTAAVAALLHERLQQVAYPSRVAVGAVSDDVVIRAGGDVAYFGAGGGRVVPQFPRDVERPRWRDGDPFPLPARRADVSESGDR